jgi:hypothetical protein
MLNKEHEKVEDSKPAATPAVAGSWMPLFASFGWYQSLTQHWAKKVVKAVSLPSVLTLNLHFDVNFMYDAVNGKSLRSVSFRSFWGLI